MIPFVKPHKHFKTLSEGLRSLSGKVLKKIGTGHIKRSFLYTKSNVIHFGLFGLFYLRKMGVQNVLTVSDSL